MNRTEFLQDTINYYANHSRSVDKLGQCLYRKENVDGSVDKCAIGRWIDDKDYSVELEDKSVQYLMKDYSVLPDHISELGVHFLLDVQKLHDYSSNWIATLNGNKLSKLGIDSIDEMISEHNLDNIYYD